MDGLLDTTRQGRTNLRNALFALLLAALDAHRADSQHSTRSVRNRRDARRRRHGRGVSRDGHEAEAPGGAEGSTAALTGDSDRLARFQREAEVLAALNHPHIAAIYGIEDADGTKSLVVELVEGPTLADRIAGQPSQE